MQTKPPGLAAVSTAGLTLLAVTASQSEQACLRHILQQSDDTGGGCRVYTCRTLPRALDMLQRNHIPVVVFDGDSNTCSWRRMLERTGAMADPPAVIVTSRLADEHLWAEALNRGAYDVLAKPFDNEEVARVVRLAWLHATVRRDRLPGAGETHRASGGAYQGTGGG